MGNQARLGPGLHRRQRAKLSLSPPSRPSVATIRVRWTRKRCKTPQSLASEKRAIDKVGSRSSASNATCWSLADFTEGLDSLESKEGCIQRYKELSLPIRSIHLPSCYPPSFFITLLLELPSLATIQGHLPRLSESIYLQRCVPPAFSLPSWQLLQLHLLRHPN